MQNRRLGATGLEVSRIGLGTMQWGTAVDEHDAQDQLRTFLDAGGTLIDTAWSYGLGASESLLGELVSKNNCRDRVVLASKAGLRADADGMRPDASRRSLLAQLDESLARLGTDHLDLWQLSGWDERTPVRETLTTLESVVRSGRVRYVGICNFTGWQTAQAQTWLAGRADALTLASTQVEYSLLNRDLEAEIAPAAAAMDMGLLAWSSLGRGVLTGKYRLGVPGDSRAATPGIDQFVAPYLNPRCSAIVEAVARASEGLQAEPAQVALAWLRDRPGVCSTLVGARTAAQLEVSLAAETVDLPDEIAIALNEVSEAWD